MSDPDWLEDLNGPLITPRPQRPEVTTIRIPADLHTLLRLYGTLSGATVNDIILELISRWMAVKGREELARMLAAETARTGITINATDSQAAIPTIQETPAPKPNTPLEKAVRKVLTSQSALTNGVTMAMVTKRLRTLAPKISTAGPDGAFQALFEALDQQGARQGTRWYARPAP